MPGRLAETGVAAVTSTREARSRGRRVGRAGRARAPGQQPVTESSRIVPGLVLPAQCVGLRSTPEQIRLHLVAVTEVVADDGVDVRQIQGGIALADLLGGRTRMESGHHRVQRHARRRHAPRAVGIDAQRHGERHYPLRFCLRNFTHRLTCTFDVIVLIVPEPFTQPGRTDVTVAPKHRRATEIAGPRKRGGERDRRRGTGAG